jgi:Fe-S-cluster-containing dehydrogenase component
MKRYRLIIDVEKCENCGNCFLSCKDEHVGNDWPDYAGGMPDQGPSWIRIEARERGQYPLIDVAYLPVPCMHCDKAPCVDASKGAFLKRADGVVIADPEKSKGRKDLEGACPYGAIQWNNELQLAQKCTFCAHLLDKGWKTPRCVQSCPTGALTFHSIEDDEMDRLVKEQKLEIYRPEADTRPSVYYRNLHHFTKCFIAGSVATRSGLIPGGEEGKEECVEGARVLLFDSKGTRRGETRTDPFGDFKFDGLDGDSGTYTVQVETGGRVAGPVAVEVRESVSIGIIYI